MTGLRQWLLPIWSAVLVAAAPCLAQIHSSQLPPLTPETVFPRTTPGELEVAGFPDHMHAYHWAGWEAPLGPEGKAVGPGTLCANREALPVEGLVVDPDEKRKGFFVLRHHPGYGDGDMLPCLELFEWAGATVPGLLGFTLADTLTVLNPENVAQYTELTGQGTWRLYRLDGDAATLQPYPVLESRTLAAHAAFMLVTDWILRENVGDRLPPWLQQGIVEYIGEDGVHLANYMVQFRQDKEFLLSPPLVDALLAAGIDADPGQDREMFRRACYSSFLMVWQLVEDEGGLASLRDFLALVANGADLDQASRDIYGMNLGDLATVLDAAANGEPVSGGMVARRPHDQP